MKHVGLNAIKTPPPALNLLELDLKVKGSIVAMWSCTSRFVRKADWKQMRKTLGHKNAPCLARQARLQVGCLFLRYKLQKWFICFKCFAPTVGISFFLFFCRFCPLLLPVFMASQGCAHGIGTLWCRNPWRWGAARSLPVGAIPWGDENSKKTDEDCSALAKLSLTPQTRRTMSCDRSGLKWPGRTDGEDLALYKPLGLLQLHALIKTSRPPKIKRMLALSFPVR